MAALMRSVRIGKAIQLHHRVSRNISLLNQVTRNQVTTYASRTTSYGNRIVYGISRYSSSAPPQVAIIGQGRRDGTPARRNTRVNSNEADTSPPTVTESLKHLNEIMSSKTGIVTAGMLNRILRLVVKEGQSIDVRDSISLLHCTGQSLTFTAKKDRVMLMNKILTKYEEMGIQLTTGHYNAILKSNCENGVDFNPIQFLADMESKGCSPNPTTYQHLIGKFCSDGNVDAASEILQHMKQCEIPVSENIFAAFVTGYMKAGNIEKAKQIPEVMAANGMQASERLSGTFLQAYARHGNIEGIREILGDRQLSEEHLYNAVLELAESGHEQHIGEVVGVLVERGGGDQAHVVRSIRQLVAAGHTNTALQLFHALRRTNPNTILMPILAMHSPFETFAEVAEQLDRSLFTRENMSALAQFAVRTARAEVGVSVLHFLHTRHAMPVSGGSVRRLLGRIHGPATAPADTAAVLYKAAAMLSGSPSDVSLAASRLLLAGRDSMPEMERGLRGAGVSSAHLPLVTYLALLRCGRFTEAQDYVAGAGRAEEVAAAAGLVTETLRDVMLQGYENSGSLEATLSAVPHITSTLNLPPHQLSSDFLSRIVASRHGTAQELEKCLQLMEEKELKILARYRSSLHRALGEKQAAGHVVKQLDGLVQQEEPVPTWQQMHKMPTEELEKLLPRLRQRRNLLNIANASRVLLRRYCAADASQDMHEKITQLAQLLETNQSSYDFPTLRALVNYYAVKREDLGMTLRLYACVRERFAAYKDSARLVLEVATLQARCGHGAEAIATVTAHLETTAATAATTATGEQEGAEQEGGGQEAGFEASKVLAGSCVRLLSALESPQQVEEMHALLVRGFVAEDAYSLVKGVTLAHLRLHNTPAVLQHLAKLDPDEELVGEVVSTLVARGDEEGVAQVLDTLRGSGRAGRGAVVCGEAAVVRALLQHEGRVEEAGRRLGQAGDTGPVLTRLCGWLVRDRDVAAMSQLLELSRGGRDSPWATEERREQIIFSLLKLHVARRDSAAALDTFVLFEAERVSPGRRTLRTVGQLLNSLNVTALPTQLTTAAAPSTAQHTEPDMAQPYEEVEKTSSEQERSGEAESVEAGTAQEETQTQPHKETENREAETVGEAVEPKSSKPQSNEPQEAASSGGDKLSALLHQVASDIDVLRRYCTRENLHMLSLQQGEPRAQQLYRALQDGAQAADSADTVTAVAQHYCDVGRHSDARALMAKHGGVSVDGVLSRDVLAAMTEPQLHEWSKAGAGDGAGSGSAVKERLLLARLAAGDWQGALQYYDDTLSPDTRIVLETALLVHDQPLPW